MVKMEHNTLFDTCFRLLSFIFNKHIKHIQTFSSVRNIKQGSSFEQDILLLDLLFLEILQKPRLYASQIKPRLLIGEMF